MTVGARAIPAFDQLLPGAPFREVHRRVVTAPVEEVWPQCLAVRASDIRALGPLVAVRALPARLQRRRSPRLGAPAPLIEAFTREGFVVLRCNPEPIDGRASVVLGAAGRFWSITGNAPVRFGGRSAHSDFLAFADPGYAKTVVRLDATDRGDGTTELVTETLVTGTDASSTRRFAPYWALIRLPSGLIRRSWLAAIDARVRSRSAGAVRGADRGRSASDTAPLHIADLWPRRAPDLPRGQRQIRAFPRFSDRPWRPAPAPADLSLVISVDGERSTVTGADLRRFPLIDQTSDFHCVTTWTTRGLRWRGVRMAEVVASVVGPEPPPHVTASATDGVTAVFLTEDLLRPDVLLATHLDGEPLDARHGAPLRLVSPGQYGYKNVKHLVGLDFSWSEPSSTLGPKEHRRARVDREERHARLPGWLVRIPYRLAVVPTALAAERSLRTSPPPDQRVSRPGT